MHKKVKISIEKSLNNFLSLSLFEELLYALLFCYPILVKNTIFDTKFNSTDFSPITCGNVLIEKLLGNK